MSFFLRHFAGFMIQIGASMLLCLIPFRSEDFRYPKKWVLSACAYMDKTAVLQIINDSFTYGTDMEFAKELFNIPLPDRYRWLEEKVDESLHQAGVSFEDYNEVMEFVEKLKGGSHGRY